ncbi:MAG: hypothetical protein C0442_11025, partial [Chlorobiaceae bacterium]|nr:hypothetical protein [Chlorobiaceae bacterium]
VEIQDIEGFGYRLSQGKKAGIICDDILIQIFSHGSKSQMDIVYQKWAHITEYDKMYKEKIALEFADRIIFPTNYIYQVFQNAGYRHQAESAIFIRPPYNFSQFTITDYQNIDTLIFYGKRIWAKGFDLFSELVSLLDLEGIIGNQIKRIILIGPHFQEMEKQNSYFEALKNRILILDASMQRNNAIQSIKNFSKQSLCVLPYRADNHPYSLLELIETGCSFVCANKGGIPEMIPNKFHDLVLSDYNPDDFVLKTKNLINMEIKERQKLFSDIATTMVAQQEEINETYKNFHSKTDNIKAILPKEKLNSSLIITIKSNNDLYNSILINALNSQSVFPSELYLISDKESTAEIFTNALNKNIKTKIKLFEKNWNYSKNRVIDEIKNDIIISLGANDIPKQDFVERYTDFFLRNDSSKFVSSYLELVKNGNDPIDSTKVENLIAPLGNIGLLNFSFQNNYAHQSFAIRSNFFKSLNGFEEISSKDDLLTIVKIKSSGAAIDLINKSLVIRLDQNTTNRKEEFDLDDFNNQKLLASSYQSLDKFDSYRLVGLKIALLTFTSDAFRFDLNEIEKKLITIQTLLHSGLILEAKQIVDSIEKNKLKHSSKETKFKVISIDKKITEIISKFNLDTPKQNNNKPLVTVIIPTFNRRTHVEEALLSVINQTYKNLEILVVNDAGEDIWDLIQSFNDPRIKYFMHKSNKGLAGSRNTGLNNANGDYIAFLDDDDIFYPNHIEILLNEITSSDYKVVYSDAYRCLQEFSGQKYVTVQKELKYSIEYSQPFLFALNIAPVQCFLFHKSCLSDNIRFDESLTTYEDWEFWIKLSLKNDFKHIPQVTSEYRHRNDYTNMMTTKHIDFLKTMKIIYNRYHELVADNPNILAHQNLVLKDYEEQIVNHGYHNAVSIIIVTYNSSK